MKITYDSEANASQMMRRLFVNIALVSVCTALAVPAFAQGSAARPQQDHADFQKLDAMLAFVRNRNAQDYAIAAPNSVDDARYIEIGGIEQWVTIRGEDRNNPVLLVLHGGPGDATNPWGYAGFRSWLKTFTVVQWDQRGAGRTLGNNGPSLAPTITIERMARDGIELAEWLRKTLQKNKVILVGHSWGSIQGAEDFTTPTSLARSFVNSIHAPRKAFVAIEGGGHFAVFMKAGAFLNELVARVLPQVKDR